MRARRAAGVAAALLLVPLTTSACGTAVAGPSLVLRLASPDKATDDTAAPIVHFADQVDRRSGGTIRVEPVWDVTPPGVPDWDQTTARTVMDGTFELALVPTRAFDDLGVDSLRALNAPFLVTSQAAEKAVLDSNLRDDLMAGLPDAGLVGIDLFPDALRHPFGYDRPLLGPEDYQGSLIRAATSETVDRLFASLGASGTTDDDAAEGLAGAESQFSLVPPGAGVATGNVTFFAKTNALVASAAVGARLRPDQWGVLEEAAAATRAWQFGRLPSDEDAAVGFCRQGGVIVTATADQVSALEDRTADVTDWLTSDPGTRRLVDTIGRVVAGVPDSPSVTGCPSRGGGDGAASASALDGQYDAHVLRGDLVAAGVTSESDLRENSGRYHWSLHGGRWTYDVSTNHFVATTTDSGRYEVVGSTFVFYWDDGPGDWTRMHVRKGADGSLHFTEILDGHADVQALSEGFFAVPWVPVGGQSS